MLRSDLRKYCASVVILKQFINRIVLFLALMVAKPSVAIAIAMRRMGEECYLKEVYRAVLSIEYFVSGMSFLY